MVGWHHRHNGHRFGWTPGVGDGQRGLTCCNSWGRKKSDTSEQLNWTEHSSFINIVYISTQDCHITLNRSDDCWHLWLNEHIFTSSLSNVLITIWCFVLNYLFCLVVKLLLENAMATHSSTSAWKIPWTEEPGRLQSMGSLRVGYDWTTSLALFIFMHWRRKWQPTPVFLPGESQGWGSLMGCRLWGRTVGHDWSDLAVAKLLYFDYCIPILFFFLLKDKCFTEFCCFLSNLNMNQS